MTNKSRCFLGGILIVGFSIFVGCSPVAGYSTVPRNNTEAQAAAACATANSSGNPSIVTVSWITNNSDDVFDDHIYVDGSTDFANISARYVSLIVNCGSQASRSETAGIYPYPETVITRPDSQTPISYTTDSRVVFQDTAICGNYNIRPLLNEPPLVYSSFKTFKSCYRITIPPPQAGKIVYGDPAPINARLNLAGMTGESSSRILVCSRYFSGGQPGCNNASVELSYKFTMGAQSMVRKGSESYRTGTIEVDVGDTIQFRHSVSNNSIMNSSVATYLHKYENGVLINGDGDYLSYGKRLAGHNEAGFITESTYEVRTSDAGKIICRALELRGLEGDVSAITNLPFSGTQACVRVKSADFSYKLLPCTMGNTAKNCFDNDTPDHDVIMGDVVFGGEDVKFYGAVGVYTDDTSKILSEPATSKYEMISFVIEDGAGEPAAKPMKGGYSGDNIGGDVKAPEEALTSCYYYVGMFRPCFVVASSNNATIGLNSPRIDTRKTTGSFLPVGEENEFEFIEVDLTIDDLMPGSKFCVAMSMWPAGHNDNRWVYSAPYCRTIARKPLVEFDGASVYTKGDVATSSTIKSMDFWATNENGGGLVDSLKRSDLRWKFGSWAEYGVVAEGAVKGMASGAAFGYNRYSGSTYVWGEGGDDVKTGGYLVDSNMNECSWSKITISNYRCNTTFGLGSAMGGGVGDISTDIVYEEYGDVAVSGTSTEFNFDETTCSNNENKPVFTSNASVVKLKVKNGVKIAKGCTVIIKVAGTLEIDSNIEYEDDSDFSNIKEIPQVLIFSSKIGISQNVERLDAWLMAKDGTIDTCYEVATEDLTIDKCDLQLTVNGAVTAKDLILDRTFGETKTIHAINNVAIMLDLTGSMSGYINEYKQAARELTDIVIGQGGKVALIGYKDAYLGRTSTSERPRVLCDFSTCTSSSVGNIMGSISTSGGGDAAESVLHGILYTLDSLDWDASAYKSIIVLTDIYYHTKDYGIVKNSAGVERNYSVNGGVTDTEVIKRINEQGGVKLYFISESDYRSCRRFTYSTYGHSYYGCLADATGGKVFVGTGTDFFKNITNEVVVVENGINAPMLPAELFRLNPDAYLWAYANARREQKSMIVVKLDDLPPRY